MKRLQLDHRIKFLLNGIILGFVVWAATGVLTNAKQLASVTVTLRPGGLEHTDKTFLNVGKLDEAADYELRIRSTNTWINLGTFSNTPIGNGLTFTPSKSYPTRTIQEVMLLDHDKVESDVLDAGPLSKGSYQGNNYGFEALSEFSLEAGFHWFFATPVGHAIIVGIGLAFFLIVFSNFN